MRRIIKNMGSGGRQKQSGQVAILFALTFTFMFILFAFVVDFGHLINSKINLQNAADAAAYSGAAYQAQILNRISQVNYMLRQDLKEFAMRTQVTHLRHNRGFPRGEGFISGGRDRANVEPFNCAQAHGYRALSGLRYDNITNLCRNASPSSGGLPPIVVPPVIAAFDPFAVAISAQIRRIADAANQECRAAADDNRILVNHLIQVFSTRANFHQGQVQALSDFLNQIGAGNADGNDHPVVQTAFESARRNLSLSGRDDFRMEVLQPQGGRYVSLISHRARGTVFYFDFNVRGDGCVGVPGVQDFEGQPVGVTKEESVITYFAVKLSARPRLLFMPKAWQDALFPQFEAVAAAKPFGSRVGPDTTTDALVPIPDRPGNVSRSVNFSFFPNDQTGIMNTKIMAYLDALHPFNGAGRPEGDPNIGWPDQDRAGNRLPVVAARAPTIFDAAFYSIHPDPNQTGDYLEPQYAEALYPDYLEVFDANGEPVQTRQPATRPYFPDGVGPADRGDGWIGAYARNVAGGTPFGRYASESPGSHSVVLAPGALPDINDGNAGDFGYATAAQVHSGWRPAAGRPRIGYSVKMVGFDTLLTLRVHLDRAGTTGQIGNKPTGDENLSKVFH